MKVSVYGTKRRVFAATMDVEANTLHDAAKKVLAMDWRDVFDHLDYIDDEDEGAVFIEGLAEAANTDHTICIDDDGRIYGEQTE